MARREWPLRFVCGHAGCTETANYRYSTRRDMMESFELKHYSDGCWRCVRHSRPNEVLSAENPETVAELTVEEKLHGHYFGSMGFIHGPGFRVFAKDFPPGTKVIVTARLVLPAAQGIEARSDETRSGSAEGESPVPQGCAR